MAKYLLLFLFQFVITLPSNLFAQINESDSLDFQGDLTLSGFQQKGNVQTLIFRASSNTSIKFEDHWVFKTQNSYVYQEFGNTKADEDILSLNFLYLNPHKKVYPLALAFISTNFRRDIDVRYLLGVGASAQVLESDKSWLKFSISTEYERTNFGTQTFNRSEYDGESSINTWRGTLWVSGTYTVLENKMVLKHESYYQPSLLESNNFRWRADLGVEFPIWRYLNISFNYLQTFESIVKQGQSRRDQFLTLGLTLKSY